MTPTPEQIAACMAEADRLVALSHIDIRPTDAKYLAGDIADALAARDAEIATLRADLTEARKLLAECCILSGVDTDGNTVENGGWVHLWRGAVEDVRQLRADYDEACDEGWAAEKERDELRADLTEARDRHKRAWEALCAIGEQLAAAGHETLLPERALRVGEAVEKVIAERNREIRNREAAHAILTAAGVPQAGGAACDSLTCTSHLTHRTHMLVAERDELRARVAEVAALRADLDRACDAENANSRDLEAARARAESAEQDRDTLRRELEEVRVALTTERENYAERDRLAIRLRYALSMLVSDCSDTPMVDSPHYAAAAHALDESATALGLLTANLTAATALGGADGRE